MTGITAEQRRILRPILSNFDQPEKTAVENAVLAASEAHGSYFLAETVLGMRQREKRAWTVAIVGLVAGMAGILVGAYGLVKNETQAYLAIVDKDTGIAERAVTVKRASVDQQQAVVESLIFSYVKDRETYDSDDNEYRILSVFQRSAPNVRRALEALWSPEHPAFPPDIYGMDGQVKVTIRNIVMVDEDTAQVRFGKRLTKPNSAVQEGEFVATVTYRFQPATVENNLLLWQNPFGFQIVGYRVASQGSNG